MRYESAIRELALTMERLPAGSSHLNRIARWLNEEWGCERGFSLASTQQWCTEVAAAENEALIGAFEDGTLVGTALLVESDLEQEPDLAPWLSGLYVAAGHRRLGIGARLVREVEAVARGLGHALLYLYCRCGPLEGYYARLGWQPVRKISVDGRPYAVMVRKLG